MGLLKYDVGDKVKVKTNLLVVTDQASSEKYKHSKIAINEDMAQYMGKTMTVFAILDDLYLMDEDIKNVRVNKMNLEFKVERFTNLKFKTNSSIFSSYSAKCVIPSASLLYLSKVLFPVCNSIMNPFKASHVLKSLP